MPGNGTPNYPVISSGAATVPVICCLSLQKRMERIVSAMLVFILAVILWLQVQLGIDVNNPCSVHSHSSDCTSTH